MRKILAALVLVLSVFGILGFASTDKLPGQVLVWVRPEEIVRGQGTPSIVFLVANATGKPLALNSIDTKKDGLLCASQAVRRSLPILTAAESKTLMDVISGARLDFPKELASRICIMSVPIAVEHDGLSEKAVKLSADLVFDDGSSRTLEATALLTTTLPAEPGWVAGDGHIHSNYSDGAYDIFQRRNDAINFGYKWIFMTDHSGALSSHPNHSQYPWTDFPKSTPGYRFFELFSNERVPSSTTLADWRGQLNYDRPNKIAAGDSGPFTVAVSGSDAHLIGTPYWGKNMTYLKASLTPLP